MGSKSANIDITDSSILLLLVYQLDNTETVNTSVCVHTYVSNPHCCK